ncbi:hypothetical protein [Phenylobacterium sp.]|uniref:hypothetical protein n=1 Tax=Phenylobacterium sp. TaxID=1871053 RepID=UPI002FC9DEA8
MTYGRARHHAERVFAVATDSSAAARSAIAASWVRSLNDYGLDPESPRRPERVEQARLDEARDRFALMLQAAEPALDRRIAQRRHRFIDGGQGAAILPAD